MSGMKEPAGLQVNSRLQKNGVGVQYRTARMWIDFTESKFDLEHELASAAVHYGVVEKSGAWFHVLDETGSRNGNKPLQGSKNLRKLIKEDPNFKQRILEAWKANE